MVLGLSTDIQCISKYPDAGHPDRLGPSGKHFFTVTVLYFVRLNFSPHLSNAYKELCIDVLFVRK